MASATQTRDHDEIRQWVEERGGIPTIVDGTGGLLRIDFVKGSKSGGREPKLDETNWDEWFRIFDDNDLVFLYQPEGESRFVKLISGETASENKSRRRSVKSSGRKSTRPARSSGARRNAGSRRTSSRSAGTRKSTRSASSRRGSSRKASRSSRSTGRRGTPQRRASAGKTARKSSGRSRSTSGRSRSSGGKRSSSSSRIRKLTRELEECRSE